MQKTMRTGAAAEEIGIHPQTLRRWEREGRIPRASRNELTGQRVYTPEDLRRLIEIVKNGQ